jgi:hypothetical protein
MIQVASKAEAIAWAVRCPASPNEMIEIRQVQELEDFEPSEGIAREERIRDALEKK